MEGLNSKIKEKSLDPTRLYEDLGNPCKMPYSTLAICVSVLTLLLIIIGAVWYLLRGRVYRGIFPKKRKGVKTFRRRDTVAFIGKKLIHRIADFKKFNEIYRTRKPESLCYQRRSKFKLRTSITGRGLPTFESVEHDFPKEYENVIIALKKIFMFDLEALKHILNSMVTRSVDKNHVLFTEDQFNGLHIVKSGSIELIYSDEHLLNLPLRIFEPAEPICTMIFLLENILLKEPPKNIYKLKAVALETSIICTIPFEVLKNIFSKDAGSLARLIQISAIRIQHVVFRTLCDSFGIDLELLIKTCGSDFTKHAEQENLFPDIFEPVNDAIIQSISMIIPSNINTFKKQENATEIDKKSKFECVESILKIFETDDKDILMSEGLFLKFYQGQTIEDSRSNEGMLYYIYKGSIVSVHKLVDTPNKKNNELMFHTGELCGLFPILSGTRSHYQLIAKDNVEVLMISPILLRKISTKHPSVLQTLAIIISDTLSPFLKNLNFGLLWENYDTGKDLYCQGSISDKIYIIQHGRLRLIFENNLGEKCVLGEFARNDFVGIEETFERKPRSGTLTAVRATEVVVFYTSLLEFLQRFSPHVMIKIAHFLSKKIRNLSNNLGQKQYPEISSYSTVAIVPASYNIPAKNFAYELSAALNTAVPSTVVDSASISSNTNPLMSRFKYLELITHLEFDNYLIIWVCDYDFTDWTRQSILHSDLILVVASIDEDYSPNNLEMKINQMKHLCTPQNLILLHREDRYKVPDNTASWLSARNWISEYYHIRCPNQIFRKEVHYMKYFNSPDFQPPLIKSDLSRLARRITNSSIGLVLGGGGARGHAHIGAIRALEQAGIPIDMIGGCSIGASFGALYATYHDSTYLTRRAYKFAEEGSSIFSYLSDLTLPLVSFLTGSCLNKNLISAFKDRTIEDLLIPYFCITTDISSLQLKVHTCGPIWRACRGSMTLLNLLPPICDEKNNHLLIDGGYLNVLPYDIMFRKGAKYVIAVDVSRGHDYVLGDYGDELSGWRVLWNKICPFGKKLNIPSLSEIHENLISISCIKSLKEATNVSNLLYLSPPIKGYHILGFQYHKEIEKLGFEYTERVLKETGFTENGDFRLLFKEKSDYFESKGFYSEMHDDVFNLIKRKSQRRLFENLSLPSENVESITPPTEKIEDQLQLPKQD